MHKYFLSAVHCWEFGQQGQEFKQHVWECEECEALSDKTMKAQEYVKCEKLHAKLHIHPLLSLKNKNYFENSGGLYYLLFVWSTLFKQQQVIILIHLSAAIRAFL